jgi:mono/diheme cytochrome c family protein
LGPSSGVSSFSDRKTLANKSDQDLFEKITRGGRGSGMPAWEGILSEQDRWNVIAYIRSLGHS